MTTAQGAPGVSESQEAALELALSGLDEIETIGGVDELVLAPTEEVIEEPVDEASVLNDGELDALELAVDKGETYASQESAVIGATESGEVKKKRTSAPRTPRDLNSVDAKHFVLFGDVSKTSDADKEACKNAAMASVPTQVKVAEKFENVFGAMSVGKAPSKYVMTAFGALDVKKEITSSEIIAAFKTSGVGEGTARSQTGQIMALLPVLGIAERDGKTLRLNEDSNVAAYLRSHAAT